MSHPVLTFSAQSFGEVYSITRIPNGDLHVDFRKSEVAETVCLICFGPSETLKVFVRFVDYMQGFISEVLGAWVCRGIRERDHDDTLLVFELHQRSSPRTCCFLETI